MDVTLYCDECGEIIEPDQPKVKYEGEWCHLDCAAHAYDAIGFDDFLGDNG